MILNFKVSCTSLLLADVLAQSGLAFATSINSSGPKNVCFTVALSLSNHSAVYYPGSAEYIADMSHYAASAQENSTCSVEPGSPSDLGETLRILGTTRTPFAVKGGGHNLNPGFSSTSGVLISLARFSEVNYNSDHQTVEVGAGLVWDNVYAQLEPFNVSVVGGRATGVGVSGFLVGGGGYSYKSNQYGLGVDTITAMEVVLPSGQVTTVTHDSDEDLFFALRGGGNNFGIVTKFIMEAHPQSAVWGGTITYTMDQFDAVAAAVLNYTSNSKFTKAALQCTFATLAGQGLIMVNIFYDEPTPPAGIFDSFLTIPSSAQDVGTRSYLSLILSANTDITSGLRGIYTTVSHTAVTSRLINAMKNETSYYSNLLQSSSLVLNGYVIEPFLPSAYEQAKTATPFPADRSQTIHPMNIYYAWTDSGSDNAVVSAASQTAANLRRVAEADEILASVLYPNYASFETSVDDLYGENVDRLRSIKLRVDPLNVMGLAGGFKF